MGCHLGVFAARSRSLPLADEARHDLLLEISATLVDQPGVYPEFHLWVVEERERPVGCAVMTPPFNLVVLQPRIQGAISRLAQAPHRDWIAPPGVTGRPRRSRSSCQPGPWPRASQPRWEMRQRISTSARSESRPHRPRLAGGGLEDRHQGPSDIAQSHKMMTPDQDSGSGSPTSRGSSPLFDSSASLVDFLETERQTLW
jgi:hypothetical protein